MRTRMSSRTGPQAPRARGGADFLVVEGGQHGDRPVGRHRSGRVPDERGEPGVRGGEVVQPARAKNSPRAPNRPAPGCPRATFVAADLPGSTAAPGTRFAWRPRRSAPAGVAEAEDRGIMCCCLSRARPSFTARSRWMASWGKRNSGPGGGEVLGCVAHHQAPGELQFAVKPGVEQRAAVDLDPGLQPAELAGGGLGLEFERRRIGVRAEDVEAGGGSSSRRRYPGDEGAVADHVEPAGGTRGCRAVPGCSSSRPVNPALSSRRAASWTAWKLEGDALTYAPRSWIGLRLWRRKAWLRV